MKHILIAALMLLVLPFAGAHEFSAKAINIDHPWAKPNASAEVPGLVYFTLENKGAESDRLLEVTVDTKIAKASMLRSINRAGGKVQISYLANGLDVPAGAPMAEGYYVMLTGLSEALSEGRRFPITLVFERAGEVEVEVVVEKAPKPVRHPVAASHTGHEGHGS